MAARGDEEELSIGGRRVKVSRLDKLMYPKAGFTKAHVLDYYARIAPVLLPHLAGRPLTLKRYPNGVEGPFFYEKRCPAHRPSWVKTTEVWSERQGESLHYCVIGDLPSLVWAANLADLELHVSLSKGKAIRNPTALAFDLDPGAPATIVECCEVALLLRESLGELGLVAYPKTSGSKGLQLYVPLDGKQTYDVTKPFARALAETWEARRPDLVVSRMQKSLRGGKVLVDWSQNDEHKTTVCVYSLRAKERPTVSTPVTWAEVEACRKAGDPSRLVFTSDQVLARVEKHGDLFEALLAGGQRLPAAPVPDDAPPPRKAAKRKPAQRRPARSRGRRT